MAVLIKSDNEIQIMREAGIILAKVHEELATIIKPGISTNDINLIGEKIIRSYGCIPSFLNYGGYPASICVSVNEVVVHGIPKKKHMIQDGDIISLDAGVYYKGYHSDAARTYPVGQISEDARLLIERTENSFYEGLKMARAGNRLHDISNAIDKYIRQFGYGIVRDLVGHGIGASLHEEPQIPNFAQRKRGLKLQPGMTLAIEPMINIGRGDVEWLDDDWTVVSEDGSLSAHYENTILITDGDPEIFTILK